MEATGSFQMLVHICQTAQHHMSKVHMSNQTLDMYIEDINSFKMSLSYEEECCAGCLVIAPNMVAVKALKFCICLDTL